jgi:hypothetical protein
LRAKAWGFTVRLRSDASDLVVKVASPDLFPDAASVYEILGRAQELGVGQPVMSWRTSQHGVTVFPFISDEELSMHRAVEAARDFGKIQHAVSQVSPHNVKMIETAQVVDDVVSDCEGLSTECVHLLMDNAESLRNISRTLDREAPRSLDHPDLNFSNVLVRPSGELAFIDWEEATWSCALFSLDRLLDDIPDEDHRQAARDAYVLGVSGGVNISEMRRLLELALIIVPLRRAKEARDFADGVGRLDRHTRFVETLIQTCLTRLRASNQTF